MLLHTTRLKLRPVSMHDLEVVHDLHMFPETDRYNTLGIPENIEETRVVLQDWLSMQAIIPSRKYVFFIEDEYASFIGLMGINIGGEKYRNAELWYKLHPSCWGRGYATEAVIAALDFCFNALKLHRVTAGCATENIASARVLEKAGMLREGFKRKVLPIRGEWKDGYDYAILEEDFFDNPR